MKIGNRITLGALVLMVFAIPFAYLPFPLIYTEPIYEYSLIPKRFIFHICISIALLGWLVQAGFARQLRCIASPIILPLFCFLGVSLLSTLSSTHPLDSLVELTHQIALTCLVLVTANTLSSKNFILLLKTNAATGLALALIGILQYQNLAFDNLPTNGMPSATFGYRNFAAMYLICSIPLTALLSLVTSSKFAFFLSWISTILMGVFLIYTRTRGAWVGLTLALIIVGFIILLSPHLRILFLNTIPFKSISGKKFLLLGSITLFTYLAILPVQFVDTSLQRFDGKKTGIASTVISITEKLGDKGRRAMWNNTCRMIADYPLLGVGPGGWKRIYPFYDKGAMIRSNSSPKRPHNDYLWIASEHGILGLSIYIWLLISTFRSLLILSRHPKRFWRITAPFFAISLLGILGHAAFSFPKEQPQVTMFTYLLLGIIAKATSPNQYTRPSGTSAFSMLGLLFVILLSATELSRRQIGFDKHYLKTLWAEDRLDWSTAYIEADAAIKYGTFRPHILVIQGRVKQNQRSYKDAEMNYHQALNYEPFSWNAHNGLGIIYKHQKKTRKAFFHFQSALDIFPSSTQIRINLGTLYKSLGDTSRAELEYRKVLLNFPNNPSANNSMGNIYKAKGDLDSALVSYQKAIANKPNFYQAHYNLADLYRKSNLLKNAIGHYKTAARLSPDEPEIFWLLGKTFETQGNFKEAKSAYQKSVALHPHFANVYFDFANLLFSFNHYLEARNMYHVFLNLWEGESKFNKFSEDRIIECNKKLKGKYLK